MSSAAAANQETPAEFLRSFLGKVAVVKLSTGVEYHGVLVSMDSNMNIAMEKTEEYEDGQLKAKYGDAFLRGNNVLYVSK